MNQLSVKNELDNFDGSQKDIAVLQELDKKKVIMTSAMQWKSVSKVLVIRRGWIITWIKSRPANKADQARTFASNQQTDVDTRLQITITTSTTPTESKFA